MQPDMAQSRTEAGSAGVKLEVRVVPAAQLPLYEDVWQQLCDSLLAANVFYEPWFILAALRTETHLERLHFVLVFGPPAAGRAAPLWGFFPLERQPRCMHLPIANLAFWQRSFFYLSAPLVHREHALPTLDAFWRWFEHNPFGCHLLDTNHLPADGPFHAAWSSVVNGRAAFVLHDYARAFLAPAPGASVHVSKSNSRKWKRLASLGRVECVALTDPADADAWVERFLALEASGWKGAAGGNAFLKDPRDTAFLRQITPQGVAGGRVEMLALTLDGEPIAMKYNLLSRGGGFAFRIAFDERFAKHSPGTLLEIEMVRRICASSPPRSLDSCAVPRNPLYHHIWTDARMIRRTLLSDGTRRGDFLCSALPLARFARKLLRPRQEQDYFRVSTSLPAPQAEEPSSAAPAAPDPSAGASSSVSSAPDQAPGGGVTRVLFIMDSIWGAGGAESNLLRLTRQLPRERFECRVITFHTDESARPFLDQFPCPVEHWPMRSLVHYSSLALAWRLARLVRRERIDIVHTFFPAADLWAAPIARLAGARALVSGRRDMGLFRRPWQRFAYRALRGLYHQVQAVSEQVRTFTVRTEGVAPARTLTVYNGVTPLQPEPGEAASLRAELECPPGTLVVATVCNVRRVKGLDVLLHAVAQVRLTWPDVRFLIAGGLGTRPEQVAFNAELQQLGRELGTSDCVRFLGPNSSIPALLELSDVFALPSRSEGLSNALLEAMAAGLPCIATSVGGNPELIEDGVTGLLVPSEDPHALAGGLMALLRDAELRERLGTAGRARVLEHFSIEAMVARVTAGYAQVLRQD